MVFFAVPSMAQEKRYLEYIDIDGVSHRVEISRDGINKIGVWRPDGSPEAGITYKNGVLSGVGTFWPNGRAARAVINYENGVFSAVGTFRSDGIRETLIKHDDGVLSVIGGYLPDGNNAQAAIFYKDGKIDSMKLAHPDNPNRSIKGIIGISSGNPVYE